MFVYLITNIVNGKRYVGQTKQSLAQRWNMHVAKNHCCYLYNAIHKYGRKNFNIEALVEVSTRELANEFEIEYISRYKTMFPNGYNILPGGDEPRPLSEEERKKLSDRMKGNKFGFGISPSEETRKKLSLANKGKMLSFEHRQKIAASHIGIKPSEEAKQKMRKGGRNYPDTRRGVSEEVKHRLRISHLGKKDSEETRQKKALAQQARRARELNG